MYARKQTLLLCVLCGDSDLERYSTVRFVLVVVGDESQRNRKNRGCVFFFKKKHKMGSGCEGGHGDIFFLAQGRVQSERVEKCVDMTEELI